MTNTVPRYPSIEDYPYRVKIPVETEWSRWQEIWHWLRENLGEANHMWKYRCVLTGSPPIYDPQFGDYVFMDAKDATLFMMIWEGVRVD